MYTWFMQVSVCRFALRGNFRTYGGKYVKPSSQAESSLVSSLASVTAGPKIPI